MIKIKQGKIQQKEIHPGITKYERCLEDNRRGDRTEVRRRSTPYGRLPCSANCLCSCRKTGPARLLHLCSHQQDRRSKPHADDHRVRKNPINVPHPEPFQLWHHLHTLISAWFSYLCIVRNESTVQSYITSYTSVPVCHSKLMTLFSALWWSQPLGCIYGVPLLERRCR
jgi:hypothetical protein